MNRLKRKRRQNENLQSSLRIRGGDCFSNIGAQVYPSCENKRMASSLCFGYESTLLEPSSVGECGMSVYESFAIYPSNSFESQPPCHCLCRLVPLAMKQNMVLAGYAGVHFVICDDPVNQFGWCVY